MKNRMLITGKKKVTVIIVRRFFHRRKLCENLCSDQQTKRNDWLSLQTMLHGRKKKGIRYFLRMKVNLNYSTQIDC